MWHTLLVITLPDDASAFFFTAERLLFDVGCCSGISQDGGPAQTAAAGRITLMEQGIILEGTGTCICEGGRVLLTWLLLREKLWGWWGRMLVRGGALASRSSCGDSSDSHCCCFCEVELRKPKQTWQRFLPLCSLQPAVTFARASKATLQT